MSPKIKAIGDPEDKKGRPNEMPQQMKMRKLEPCEGTQTKPVILKSLTNMVPEDKIKGMKKLGNPKIDCHHISGQVLESIEKIGDHKGFTVGNGEHKMYCGHVIQTIPKGGYARIGGGKSIYSAQPPVKKGPKMTFKFDKSRQIAIKVGNNVGKDWVVIVGANGCIFLDTGSYASFHMPVFVVEQTGDYYKVSRGNRILLLGTGHHLMFYTYESPILYVRKHTITHHDSIPRSALPVTSQKSEKLKSNSLGSNEPLDQMHKENKNVLKKVESSVGKELGEPKKKEPKKETPNITIDQIIKPKSKEHIETIGPVVPPPPKVEEDSLFKETPKPEPAKEIKGLIVTTPPKEESPKHVNITITAPRERSPTLVQPQDEQNHWRGFGAVIVVILVCLLLLYALYRLIFGDSSVLMNRHSYGKKLCRICNTNYV